MDEASVPEKTPALELQLKQAEVLEELHRLIENPFVSLELSEALKRVSARLSACLSNRK